jgi:hypothetical protein
MLILLNIMTILQKFSPPYQVFSVMVTIFMYTGLYTHIYVIMSKTCVKITLLLCQFHCDFQIEESIDQINAFNLLKNTCLNNLAVLHHLNAFFFRK